MVGLGGAEGRFKGSSVLKDLNLFKVSTLRALTAFHPTQWRRFSAYTLRCMRGDSTVVQKEEKGNRMVTPLQVFSPEDVTYSVGI